MTKIETIIQLLQEEKESLLKKIAAVEKVLAVYSGLPSDEIIKSDTSSKLPDEKPFVSPNPDHVNLDLYGDATSERPTGLMNIAKDIEVKTKKHGGSITKKTRVCDKCGDEYTPTGNRQRFCDSCRLTKFIPKAKKPPPPKPPKMQTIQERIDEDKGRNKGETVSTDDIKMINCAMCGTSFLATAPEDKFCGARCESFFKKKYEK